MKYYLFHIYLFVGVKVQLYISNYIDVDKCNNKE
jgi:hypothetical protein